MEEKSPSLGALEALLFASSSPLSPGEISRLLGVSLREVERLLGLLEQELARPERGLSLRRVAGGFRLLTRPEHAPLVEKVVGNHRRLPLSRAVLATLAIVAARQPVTRSEIEELRGADSARPLRLLLEMGLVKQVGRRPGPGAPPLYGTTRAFLERFGLESLDALRKGLLSADGRASQQPEAGWGKT